MFLVGSRCFNIIENPHDWDFQYIRSNKKLKKEVSFSEIYKVQKKYNIKNNEKIDMFSFLYTKYIKNKRLEIPENSYLQFLIPYLDNRINKNSPFTCYFNKKSAINYILSRIGCSTFNIKLFYALEIFTYFLEHDYVFNPTLEEKLLINNLHDKKLSEKEFIEYKNNLKARLLNLNSKLY